MGVLREEPRARGPRRRSLYHPAHHRGNRACVRRFRGRCNRRRCQPAYARRGTLTAVAQRRLRLGMVGGGDGAFIGAVHRMAARLDDEFELVAGALASTPARARASAAALRLPLERSYDDYATMAARERARV